MSSKVLISTATAAVACYMRTIDHRVFASSGCGCPSEKTKPCNSCDFPPKPPCSEFDCPPAARCYKCYELQLGPCTKVKDLPIYDNSCNFDYEVIENLSMMDRFKNWSAQKQKEKTQQLQTFLFHTGHKYGAFCNIKKPEDIPLFPDSYDQLKIGFISLSTLGGYTVGQKGCPTRFRKYSCIIFGTFAGLCLCYPIQAVAAYRKMANRLISSSNSMTKNIWMYDQGCPTDPCESVSVTTNDCGCAKDFGMSKREDRDLYTNRSDKCCGK